ncbi:MAG: hypothetical protein P4L22_06620 [Candidatus Babeliales bacterium]|nr:hypothetical protein [Candidatus Babeliales bacterium]
MQFSKYILLILLQISYIGFELADDAPKKGGTLGLSIKGGVITIAGSSSPVSPTDNVQALATIPEPPSTAPAADQSAAPAADQPATESSPDQSLSTDQPVPAE